jgi:SAM-dependent methyltransferase
MLRLIWQLLEKNWAYKLFRNWVGPQDFVQYINTRWQRAKPGMKVLDLGCGTGDALLRLPEVHYVGVDFNPDYIAMCQQRFGNRGEFIVLDLATQDLPNEAEFDLALLYGVLHHIDDEGCKGLLLKAYRALKPGGRLITVDGVYHKGQRWLSRWVVSMDRGRFVRDEQSYLDLARAVFPQVNHEVAEGRIKIPYSHMIMECCREV